MFILRMDEGIDLANERARLEQNRDAGEPLEIQEETQEAVDLLNELQCQYEAVC